MNPWSHLACILAFSALLALPLSSSAQSAAEWANLSEKLSDQKLRGKGIFVQRCSLCHLPKEIKPKSIPPVGPLLNGILKDASPNKEKTVLEFILKGSPNMPGFQYGLESSEIDDLMAYLRTL